MDKTVLSLIDDMAPLAVELERELTRRPAVSPDAGGEGEIEKARFLEGWLRERGIDALERFDAPDPRAKEGIRPNLVATIPGRDDVVRQSRTTERLWIMSHLDVVPPGDSSLWETDPWEMQVRAGRLIGRGVEDNQQGLCSSVLAVLALKGAGAMPSRTVKLLFAADEENGSHYGIEWLLREHPDLFRPGDWALVPDGGDSRGETIEVAEKNIAWMRFTVSGAQSHGSRPDQGSNAFLAGSDLALRLHRGLYGKFNFRDSLFDPPYSTFEPTKKEANVPNINTIPGEDVFYYDMRILPRFPVEDVEAEVGRICRELEGEYPVRVGYSFLQRMESRPTAADSPLVKTLAGLIKTVYGVDPRPIGIGGGTVAAYLRNAGMDCAVWARIEENAHQPNESALVEYILGDAKVMALLARNAA